MALDGVAGAAPATAGRGAGSGAARDRSRLLEWRHSVERTSRGCVRRGRWRRHKAVTVFSSGEPAAWAFCRNPCPHRRAPPGPGRFALALRPGVHAARHLQQPAAPRPAGRWLVRREQQAPRRMPARRSAEAVSRSVACLAPRPTRQALLRSRQSASTTAAASDARVAPRQRPSRYVQRRPWRTRRTSRCTSRMRPGATRRCEPQPTAARRRSTQPASRRPGRQTRTHPCAHGTFDASARQSLVHARLRSARPLSYGERSESGFLRSAVAPMSSATSSDPASCSTDARHSATASALRPSRSRRYRSTPSRSSRRQRVK